MIQLNSKHIRTDRVNNIQWIKCPGCGARANIVKSRDYPEYKVVRCQDYPEHDFLTVIRTFANNELIREI